MATISHRAPGQAHVVTAALLASTVASSPLPRNRRWLHSSHTPNVSASDRRRNDSSSQKSSDRSSLGQPARREGVNDEDSDSAVGFGGASSSSLPHTSSPSGASGRGDGRRPSPSTSQNGAQNASRPSRRAPPPASMLISGSAGKGAIPGYGKMNMAGAVPDQSRMTTRERDDEMVRGYEHSYAPSMRSPRAMPHHTYFSTPSTSFNAATSQLAVSSSGASTQAGAPLRPKKTALIFPGQGSQYVAMCRDIYRSFRSARSVWHLAEEALVSPLLPAGADSGLESHHTSLGYIPGSGQERAHSEQQRRTFEEELAKSHRWDEMRESRGRRGWLRDSVFFGDQLNLTRAENAQPSILVATLSILAVLRKEFRTDLISAQVTHASGHGSGAYAALVGSGALDMIDAVRLLRHRGLISSHHVANHPVLFPPGAARPESVYETWAFANAGSGKGVELLSDENFARDNPGGGVPPLSSASDGEVASREAERQQREQQGQSGRMMPARRGWKRTQMSGVMVRPGMLSAVVDEVTAVQAEIKAGQIGDVSADEVVEIANINSSLQVVLSGTRVGVSLACDRLRIKGLGARAVNLPVSGPYHSSLMQGAVLGPALANLPLRDPDPGMTLVSSVDGSILSSADQVRADLTGALAKPVRWLDAVDSLRAQGVERFICLGPGRACAHLLSKELGYREKVDRAVRKSKRNAAAGQDDHKEPDYEVWSVATVEDIETLSHLLAQVNSGDGASTGATAGDRRRGGVDRATLAV